jgi:dipeptidyl aminopeptidase/acylaminoacyl peptidase
VVLAMYVAETAGANCYVLSILDLRTGQLTDLDGTLVKDQTDKENRALELPAWSPDGTKIAFTRLDETLYKRELWVINADGSNPTRVALAADVSPQEPRWSPDGTRIAFTSETQLSDGAPDSAVFVLDLTTGRLEGVTIDSDPAARQLCCAEWISTTRLRVEGGARTDPDRFWLVAMDASPHEAQDLVDLTEPLASIDSPHTATTRSAPGDPGRTFFWQPVPEAQP